MELSHDEALRLAVRANLSDMAWRRRPTTEAGRDSSENNF
jgi:hypothetical protein